MSEVMRQLPQYLCHKKVWALKIKEIVQGTEPKPQDGGTWLLKPENELYAPIEVPHAWFTKHKPEAGGYWVQYEDGYTSYSPAAAFESGYTAVRPVIKPVEPEKTHNCGRRMSGAAGFNDHVRADGTCSYCGSLMGDQFMQLLRDGSVQLTPTDKNYKVYVDGLVNPRAGKLRIDGVAGRQTSDWVPFTEAQHRQIADECGSSYLEEGKHWISISEERPTKTGKFYFQHLTVDQQHEFISLLNAKRLKIGMPGHFYRLPFFCTELN